MRAECWLLEESRYEAMILNIVNVLLFECTFSVSLPDINLILLLFGHIIVVGHGVCYLFVSCFSTFLLLFVYAAALLLLLLPLLWRGIGNVDPMLLYPVQRRSRRGFLLAAVVGRIIVDVNFQTLL